MKAKKFNKKHILQFAVIIFAILIIGLWGCEKTRNYNTDQKNNIINNPSEANLTSNRPNPSAHPQQNQEANQSSTDKNQTSDNSNVRSGLTPWQVKNGIGPVKKDIKLGPINPKLVLEGKRLFNTTCIACHKLDTKFIGPSQRNLVERRTPEYIMNMILNPTGMIHKNPSAEKMLKKYKVPMTDLHLTRHQARSLLEFFRYADKQKPNSPNNL